jgi:hypothetical protein
MAYQLSAINMFTDYDGNRNGFGDTLVKTDYANEFVTVYSSIDKADPDTVKIIVINKSIHEPETVNINISSDNSFDTAKVFALYGDSPEIRTEPEVAGISDNAFEYTVEPLSVTEFVVTGAREVVETEAENVAGAEDVADTAAVAETGKRPFRNIGLIFVGIGGIAVVAAWIALIIHKKKR